MYVKTTATIWNMVESKVDALFADRYAAACDWLQYGYEAAEINRDTFNRIVDDEQLGLIEKLGSRFFPEVTGTLPINVFFKAPDGVEKQESYSITISPQRRLPGHWSGYHSGYRQRVTEGVLVDIATRRYAAIERIVSDKKAMLSSLEAAYRNATSVNQLLKAWPAFTELLPESVIEQVNRKVERRKQESAIDEADAKALSVHLLKAKVAK